MVTRWNLFANKPKRFEQIVIDGGSKDKTIGVVKSYNDVVLKVDSVINHEIVSK